MSVFTNMPKEGSVFMATTVTALIVILAALVILAVITLCFKFAKGNDRMRKLSVKIARDGVSLEVENFPLANDKNVSTSTEVGVVSLEIENVPPTNDINVSTPTENNVHSG